jgi:hypothetical protein
VTPELGNTGSYSAISCSIGDREPRHDADNAPGSRTRNGEGEYDDCPRLEGIFLLVFDDNEFRMVARWAFEGPAILFDAKRHDTRKKHLRRAFWARRVLNDGGF